MKTRNIIISLLIVLALAGAGFAYWYFLMGPVETEPLVENRPASRTGFQPIGTVGTPTTGGARTGTTTSSQPRTPVTTSLPSLRLLSDTPVGGFSASTTASTTVIRWVDRGRGNVYETNYLSSAVTTISNTVVPRVFKSVWNKNLTAFVGSLFENDGSVVSTVFAQIVPRTSQATSSQNTTLAPYELRGRNIEGELIGYAASPDKSKIFLLVNENGSGVGYVGPFNGQGTTRIFSTPLTELNVDWPSDNIITVTTKGSASHLGYMYFVDPKTGSWKKVLGPTAGLSAKLNRTGKYIIYSTSMGNSLSTSIYNVPTSTSTDALITTLADKCSWGNFYKDVVYCGVADREVVGTYPDDWYEGNLATSDNIWQANAVTGEVTLLSSILGQSDRSIDAYNLATDEKDKFLFFMNKNDLSLWSLDLVKAR